MRKTITCICIFFIQNIVFSQYNLVFDTLASNLNNNAPQLIIGYINDNNESYDFQYFSQERKLIKRSQNGSVIWKKTTQLYSSEVYSKVLGQDKLNTLYVLGDSISNNPFIYKLNATTGEFMSKINLHMFSQYYTDLEAANFFVLPNNDIIFLASLNSSQTVLMFRFDSNGNFIWKSSSTIKLDYGTNVSDILSLKRCVIKNNKIYTFSNYIYDSNDPYGGKIYGINLNDGTTALNYGAGYYEAIKGIAVVENKIYYSSLKQAVGNSSDTTKLISIDTLGNNKTNVIKSVYSSNTNYNRFYNQLRQDENNNFYVEKVSTYSGTVNLPLLIKYNSNCVKLDSIEISVLNQSNTKPINYDIVDSKIFVFGSKKYLNPIENVKAFIVYDTLFNILDYKELTGTTDYKDGSWQYYKISKAGCLCASLGNSLQKYCTADASIKEITNSNFHIFPNPTSTKLTIQKKSADLEELELYNYQGQRVSIFRVSGLESEIDISTFSKGFYLLKSKNETVKLLIE